jgi:phage terminase large subunit-like protein
MAGAAANRRRRASPKSGKRLKSTGTDSPAPVVAADGSQSLAGIMPESWAARSLTERGARLAAKEWISFARLRQYPIWRPLPTWLVLGGRGAGKTRLGAEWVHGLVNRYPSFAKREHCRIALVGETLSDVREVMIDGPSGIATIARGERPDFQTSRKRLVWPNGAVAQIFSSEDPDSLRGPQFDAAWCDELAKWRYPDACFDMLQFGLRLGDRPVQLFTTTPRPIPLMRRLIGDDAVTVTHMRTTDNAANLGAGFIASIERRYGGTRLGRQELEGELIEDRPDALWTRGALEAGRGGPPERLGRIVVAVDPPASYSGRSDACGIVAAALETEAGAVVVADRTIGSAKPGEWAGRALALYHELEADCIVAEVNQGGEMVAAVFQSIDPSVPIRQARATRGKWLRAEPVAALYEQGRVRHPVPLPALEDEMCDFGPSGLSGERPPDRVDALVWAITELLHSRRASPRVRGTV